jgi:hypothetical protein
MYARFQMILTTRHLLATHKERVQLSPAAADRIYAIARTSMPHHPVVLLSRGEYLLNSGRWKEPEMDEIVGRLKTGARLQSATWLLDMFYALLLGDSDRANAALREIETSKDRHARKVMEGLKK